MLELAERSHRENLDARKAYLVGIVVFLIMGGITFLLGSEVFALPVGVAVFVGLIALYNERIIKMSAEAVRLAKEIY